ncbi:unnamed protein product, partial [Medioppia subpectinata]
MQPMDSEIRAMITDTISVDNTSYDINTQFVKHFLSAKYRASGYDNHFNTMAQLTAKQLINEQLNNTSTEQSLTTSSDYENINSDQVDKPYVFEFSTGTEYIVEPSQCLIVEVQDDQPVKTHDYQTIEASIVSNDGQQHPPAQHMAEAQVESIIQCLMDRLEPVIDIETHHRTNHLHKEFLLDGQCLGAGLSGLVVRATRRTDGTENAVKMHFIVGKEDTEDGLLREYHWRRREIDLWSGVSYGQCVQYYDSWVERDEECRQRFTRYLNTQRPDIQRLFAHQFAFANF